MQETVQQPQPQPVKAEIKHYSLKELADLFRMDRRTMRKLIATRLPELPKPEGRFYTRKEVEEIFRVLGHPDAAPPKETIDITKKKKKDK